MRQQCFLPYSEPFKHYFAFKHTDQSLYKGAPQVHRKRRAIRWSKRVPLKSALTVVSDQNNECRISTKLYLNSDLQRLRSVVLAKLRPSLILNLTRFDRRLGSERGQHQNCVKEIPSKLAENLLLLSKSAHRSEQHLQKFFRENSQRESLARRTIQQCDHRISCCSLETN